MPERRRIVPDCSVLLPAFFPETLLVGGQSFDLSARARPLELAIRSRLVRAIAPDMLLAEFLKIAWSKASDRAGPQLVLCEEAREQIFRFLQLPIVSLAASRIAGATLDLMALQAIAPADSWYVACALQANAELWISHRHSDGLVEKATARGIDVHLLAEERFSV